MIHGKKARFLAGLLLVLGLGLVMTFLYSTNNISYGSNSSVANNNNTDQNIPKKTKLSKVPKGKIKTTKVTLPNEKTGLELKGLVFTPGSMKPNAKLPAVVVGGPMFSVKEQTQSLYAQKMAGLGYVAIVFDYTYFGESEGEPRQLEDPFMKSEDIKSAVSYLESLPYVDAERIVGLGVCGTGSYMPYTAVSDRRIKAVATVVPYGGMSQMATLSLEEAREQREAYERGERDPNYTAILPDGNSEAGEYYFNPDRGAVPNWRNEYVTWSAEKWLEFNPEEALSNLGPTPLLIVTASNAWSLSSVESLYDAANGPKEFYLIEGARHFDVYDLEPYVTEAMDQVEGFFAEHLD
ncbi:alpha/beta hydrolase [Domibacillus indicus]|uniref:alpha/beta hydrolase n=1 Tax=Domibacillus indicus TaxID=1437523 RepID=UPI00203E614A|nr:alpha/beta hydrolase [Domibacillus indicus]MCM3790224.1 alpha/beta hydrolase [Domibacillus indicus]